MGVLWDTVKIFPHTPKHGSDERFISYNTASPAFNVHNQLTID